MAGDGGFIRIENLSKRFGATLAVDGVTLSIGRGEFFSLLGPSGCGKTTLLRMIGGFAVPDSGTIVIDGETVTDLPPNKRSTNMVFQSYAIFPHLNVRDNIAYGLRSEGLSPAERERRVDEALATIKLQGYGARRATQLSGGERQRVALARALVKRPSVLLLDEPLGALDKRLRESMQIELRQLQREVGISFIFVTHDQEEALSMSDRVAVMEKGRVLQIADPKTLYETPSSRSVAEFIGTINLFEGRVIATADKTVTVATEALNRVEASRGAGATFAIGSRALVAIRPERLMLSRDPPAGPCVPGRIIAAAYLGDRSQFQVAVAGAAKPVMVVAQNIHSRGDAQFGAGEAVHVSWTAGGPVLLPPE